MKKNVHIVSGRNRRNTARAGLNLGKWTKEGDNIPY